jgi:hypothetical protein
MRYFAKVENNNLVSQVIVIANDVDNPIDFIAELGIDGTWIESFMDGGSRLNMASVGYSYDPQRDVFIQNKPDLDKASDFILDEESGRWVPPLQRPDNNYYWDFEDKIWKELPNE